jgi:hypothetical protein
MVDATLAVTDAFSKMVHLFPLSTAATAEDIARIYHDGVYKHHGMQLSIISDRDPKFTGRFWKALHAKAGMRLRMSTSAHPEMDGISENRVKAVSTALRILVADNPDDWARLCTDTEFTLNSSVAGATKQSPFEGATGWQPSLWPVDSWVTTDVPGADGFTENVRLNWLKATDSIIGTRLDMAVQANKYRRSDPAEFVVGNQVYVSTKDLSFPGSMSRNFIPRYVGPFLITASNPLTSNYTITFPPPTSRYTLASTP